MKRLLLVMCLSILLPSHAHAVCEKMWDTAKLARAGGEKSVLESISTSWFQGIDIVREKIDAQSGITTTLYLCEDHEPNALAWNSFGKNFTALTLGMHQIVGNNWHIYAALIGHENAHLVKNHGVNRSIFNTVMQTAFDGSINIPGASLAIESIGASYSRTEEFEADKYGMLYAHCSGFSPEEVLHLQEKLNNGSHFLSSHPSSQSRIRRLSTAISIQKRRPKCK